jgi:hypothetical protein
VPVPSIRVPGARNGNHNFQPGSRSHAAVKRTVSVLAFFLLGPDVTLCETPRHRSGHSRSVERLADAVALVPSIDGSGRQQLARAGRLGPLPAAHTRHRLQLISASSDLIVR